MPTLNSNLNRLVTKIKESDLPNPGIIGIDGYVGSGKSRLAKALENALEATWIDTRPYQQAKDGADSPAEWFQQYYDWQGLHKDLIKPFSAGKRSKFCSDNDNKNVIQLVKHNPLMILEGPYLYHPEYAQSINFWIFIDVPREERKLRVKEDGKDELRFAKQETLEKWHRSNIFKKELFQYIHTVL